MEGNTIILSKNERKVLWLVSMCCGIISKLRLVDVFVNNWRTYLYKRTQLENVMIKNSIWLVSPQSNGQHIRYRNIDLSNNSAGLSNYLCAIEKSIYWFHFFSTSNIHILHPHFITRGNNCDRDQCSKKSEKIRKIYNSSHFKRIKILCSSNTNDKFILRWFFSSPLRMMVKFPEDMNDLLVKFYVEKILQFWEFRQMVSYYF